MAATHTMPDLLFALLLLIGVPGWKVWAGRTSTPGTDPPRSVRYRRTIALAGGLSIALAGLWWVNGRSAAALGLAWPPSRPGLIGLLVAALFLGAMSVAIRRSAGRDTTPEQREGQALLPTTTAERQLFIVFALAVGFGWEVLYRGFLLWFLVPAVGVVAAIALAAVAYSLAHGVASRRQVIGSLVSALLFTAGYWLTSSLWWLVVVHAGLPLLMLAAGERRPAPA